MEEQVQGKRGDVGLIGERYLSFSLGAEEFGVPLIVVREVIGVPECTPLPFTSEHVMGVMNLRGQVITVIDLRKRLGFDAKDHTAESAVIICEVGAVRVGLLVDSVNSVITSQASEITGRPEVEKTPKTQYISSVFRRGSHVVLFLDVGEILSADKQGIEEQQKAA